MASSHQIHPNRVASAHQVAQRLLLSSGNPDRVQLAGQQQPRTVYVTTALPHRVVKMVPVGTPVEFVLVK